jgi:hypothetical protein
MQPCFSAFDRLLMVAGAIILALLVIGYFVCDDEDESLDDDNDQTADDNSKNGDDNNSDDGNTDEKSPKDASKGALAEFVDGYLQAAAEEAGHNNLPEVTVIGRTEVEENEPDCYLYSRFADECEEASQILRAEPDEAYYRCQTGEENYASAFYCCLEEHAGGEQMDCEGTEQCLLNLLPDQPAA